MAGSEGEGDLPGDSVDLELGMMRMFRTKSTPNPTHQRSASQNQHDATGKRQRSESVHAHVLMFQEQHAFPMVQLTLTVLDLKQT